MTMLPKYACQVDVLYRAHEKRSVLCVADPDPKFVMKMPVFWRCLSKPWVRENPTQRMVMITAESGPV